MELKIDDRITRVSFRAEQVSLETTHFIGKQATDHAFRTVKLSGTDDNGKLFDVTVFLPVSACIALASDIYASK